jgi:hypothetical protein
VGDCNNKIVVVRENKVNSGGKRSKIVLFRRDGLDIRLLRIPGLPTPIGIKKPWIEYFWLQKRRVRPIGREFTSNSVNVRWKYCAFPDERYLQERGQGIEIQERLINLTKLQVITCKDMTFITVIYEKTWLE